MTDTVAVEKKDWSHSPPVVGFAWAAVGIPLLWGVLVTLLKAVALFR